MRARRWLDQGGAPKDRCAELTSSKDSCTIVGTGERSMVVDGTDRHAGREYFLPNKMGRVFLLSLEGVMGRSALHVTLSHAKLLYLINNYPPANLDLGWRFEETSAILQALEAIHGERAAQAIAVRAGRASLYHVQEDVGAILGLAERYFGILPLVPRLRAGLKALAELYNKTGDQVVRLEETAGRFLFHVDRCPACWGRTAGAPICRTEVGLLQEAMYWVSGGRNIAAEEVQCIAAGSPSCCYAVEKRLLA